MLEKIQRAFKDNCRKDRILEIHKVRQALIEYGHHRRVSPVVARWFRSKGFKIKKHRSGVYYSVELP